MPFKEDNHAWKRLPGQCMVLRRVHLLQGPSCGAEKELVPCTYTYVRLTMLVNDLKTDLSGAAET